MSHIRRFTAIIIALLAVAFVAPHARADIAGRIAAAKPRTIVHIPEGTFNIQPVIVPAHVTLQGAGYDKTFIHVKGVYGFRFIGSGGGLEDLTIDGADSDGVSLSHATGVRVSRVRALHCLNGFTIDGGAGDRIEDCVAGENRTGIALSGASSTAVVNCTVARNSALGVAISGTTGCAVFNDVFLTNGIGVYLKSNASLALDHNLYWGALIGKGRDIAMTSIRSWTDMERQDAHSISQYLAVADQEHFSYKPVTPSSWEPDRAVTSGWGVASLAGFSSPDRDIDGKVRTTGYSVGAWEAVFDPPAPPNGTLTIKAADGYKSAGLYDAKDREVNWLFSMQPLAAGTYPYWLPTRDFEGRPIPPGKYTLKISEANLALKYIGSPANTAASPTSESYASTGVEQPVFDSKDRPVLVLDWSESGRQFRAMDPHFDHERWVIPGTETDYGSASDGTGMLYSIRDSDKTTYVLSPIDEETGKIKQTAPGDYGWYLKKDDLGFINGMAVMDGKIYLASNDKNRLLIGSVANPKFDTGIDVQAPGWPSADRVRDLVWVVSNRSRIMAFTSTGAKAVDFDPHIPGLYSLAVHGNRMAAVSPVTGKITLYDITVPSNPVVHQSIGTGDGPYGPIQPDRFWFQNADLAAHTGHCKLDIDSLGNVAVSDMNGVKEFDWDGKPKRKLTGVWGQYIEKGAWLPGHPMELIDLVSASTWELDDKTGTWSPGVHYEYPNNPGFTVDDHTGFMFLRGGNRYGVNLGTLVDFDGKSRGTALMVSRYDGAHGVPIAVYANVGGSLHSAVNPAGDLTAPSNWVANADAAGKPLNPPITDPLVPQANGDILIGTNTYWHATLTGFDASGAPRYDFANSSLIRLVTDTGGTMISPYDYKTIVDFPHWARAGDEYPDGRPVAQGFALNSAKNSSGFANWAANYIFGCDQSGLLRWLQPMSQIQDPEGEKVVGDMTVTNSCPLSEMQFLDEDGLYLGAAGVPSELYWHGMWLDNTHQFIAMKGATGNTYVVYGNFNDCTTWWLQVTGANSIMRHSQSVMIDAPSAAELASRPLPDVWHAPENSTTRVKVAKLSAPMTMDGRMDKWRAAVPVPQILITPETGNGIDGPKDCSAVVRLAHEGGNLYVQAIRFDNVITMHQPLVLFYKQDGIEMSINSYLKGVKINVTHTRDHGDIVMRDGWGLPQKLLDPAVAGRSIKVYANSRDIPERKLIEQTYGVDLSDSPAIVSEFKVPLDDNTFEQRLDHKPAGTSGTTMYLGMMIDDNDSPGADVQKTMVWPATYGTFSDVSSSALVEFE